MAIIWFEFQLVIHCGVNGKINWINIEDNARNGKFTDMDYSHRCLPCPTIPLCKNNSPCSVLETQFDVNKIADELNLKLSGNPFRRSDDVGKYVIWLRMVKVIIV